MKSLFNLFGRNKAKPFGVYLEECLSKEEASRLKDIDFEMLTTIDRDERLDILSRIVESEKVEWLNSKIEKDFISKILKDQQKSLLEWIKNNREVELKWRDEIIRKISSLNKPLNEKEMDDFIEELANLTLGIGVTVEEAQKVTELCEKADEAKLVMDNGGSKSDYDIAKKNLDDYTEMLKNS